MDESVSRPPGSWRVVAASERGASHERSGQGCQDAHAWVVLPGGALVAAVADGAGSVSHGGVGAALAVRAAVDSVAESVGAGADAEPEWLRAILFAALRDARGRLDGEAQELHRPRRELATTLILVVALPAFVGTAQVGDGATVAAETAREVVGLTRPQGGEYANETIFLTSEDAISSAAVDVHHLRSRHLALFSDGLQKCALKMPEGAPHAPFFSPLFEFMAEERDGPNQSRKLAAFLRSPRVRSRSDDDLTLLLAAHG